MLVNLMLMLIARIRRDIDKSYNTVYCSAIRVAKRMIVIDKFIFDFRGECQYTAHTSRKCCICSTFKTRHINSWNDLHIANLEVAGQSKPAIICRGTQPIKYFKRWI